MPFTLAHPAAAALFPGLLRRGRLPLAAFAIGAMAPDFEYLLRLEPMAYWSHSVRGIVTFCLPVGLAVLLAWERLLREPVRHLLALPADSPPSPARGTDPPSRVARAVVSLALGSATHLFWDGFTHWDAWGVALVPALKAPAVMVLGRSVPWYNLLQHASTLVGGTVVAAWLWRRIASGGGWRAIAGTPWRRRALGGVALAMLAVAAWNAKRPGSMRDPSTAKIVVGRVAVGALAGLALGIFGFGVTFRVLGTRAAPAPDRSRKGA